MKIYTSYFAKLKSLPPDIVPIAICAQIPRWYPGLRYLKLAPKYGFFTQWKKDHNNDYYIKCFKAQVLQNLDAFRVLRDLEALSSGKDVALICYEKSSDFCHRHIVADWLNTYRLDVREWGS